MDEKVYYTRCKLSGGKELTVTEKLALDWYPTANYGRILDIMQELGYKQPPHPRNELDKVVTMFC